MNRMAVLYRILWFIDDHRRGAVMAGGALVLACVFVSWLLAPQEAQTKEHTQRVQAGLRKVQQLMSQGQYCQAFDTSMTIPRSDDPNLTQETATQQSSLLPGCQIERELSTVNELGTSPDITRLQTAQHLVQHLLKKADDYPPLYRAALEKQQQIEQRIAAVQQAQLKKTFWEHLQQQQWEEAKALLAQLRGTMRDQHAALLERSQRHDAWLKEGMLARRELRFEDTVKVLQRIMQEGASPSVEAATTALHDTQAKLAAEMQVFRTHQFPYKRTRTDVNFRAGPNTSFEPYFAIPAGTVMALLDEVLRPEESRPWARVQLTVPKPGHEHQLVGFIRSDLLVDYRE